MTHCLTSTFGIYVSVIVSSAVTASSGFSNDDVSSSFSDSFVSLPDLYNSSNDGGNSNEDVPPEYRGDKFQGDIILMPMAPRSGVNDPHRKWPEGRIPYVISGNFTDYQTAVIKSAMDTYNKKTCVQFYSKETFEKNYIDFVTNDVGCYTAVGMQGGHQIVNLSPVDCFKDNVSTLHECLHVIGWWHEQTRWDRDDYVDVITENIFPGKENQFDKISEDESSTYGLPYDYKSIMHFDEYAFSKNKLPTIVPKDQSIKSLGNRIGLTATDIAKVNVMYKCP